MNNWDLSYFTDLSSGVNRHINTLKYLKLIINTIFYIELNNWDHSYICVCIYMPPILIYLSIGSNNWDLSYFTDLSSGVNRYTNLSILTLIILIFFLRIK